MSGTEPIGEVGNEANPACAIMAEGCASEACRFRATACWIRHPAGTYPGASCYRYGCETCGGEWDVAFPMVNCTFDRRGRIVWAPTPEVWRSNGGPVVG